MEVNLNQLIQQVNTLCHDYNSKRFVPLLEADTVGYIYHLLIMEMPDLLPNLHLDSRVIGTGKNQRLDLVLGSISRPTGKRPAAQPSMIMEVKVFPEGFTDQQHRVHFEHVLNDDIPKLAQTPCPLKIELLFDTVDYLNGFYHGQRRMDKIVQTRSGLDRSIFILATYREGSLLRTRQH